MATANPAMSEAVYRRAGIAETPGQVMTVRGTVVKTAALVVILLVAAAYTWSQVAAGPTPLAYGLLIAGGIGGFVTALVTVFVPRLSPFTAPKVQSPANERVMVVEADVLDEVGVLGSVDSG